MKVLIGCESSGRVRDEFAAVGHDAWSCDLLPCKTSGNHLQCDVLTVLDRDWDLAIFHPMCTYLTGSAEWAYSDGPYHQQVQPGTLVGAARREARERAIEFVHKLRDSGIPKMAIENPTGVLSSRWRSPDQIIQPYWFGDDASKATCLWLIGLPPLVAHPSQRCNGRWVTDPRTGRRVERWANQTDSGQNREPPSEDRWAIRSITYPGIARAMAVQWSRRGLLF
jgi:hypothetical protein